MSNRALAWLCGAALVVSACGPPSPHRVELPLYTEAFAMRISWSELHAREPITVRLVVRDKKTGEPIENGEGRVFANNADGIRTFDSFVPTAESGTYTATLSFITAGEWALGVQFRRDSLSKLERPEDLRLSVGAERQ